MNKAKALLTELVSDKHFAIVLSRSCECYNTRTTLVIHIGTHISSSSSTSFQRVRIRPTAGQRKKLMKRMRGLGT